jgi:hypothetical protein
MVVLMPRIIWMSRARAALTFDCLLTYEFALRVTMCVRVICMWKNLQDLRVTVKIGDLFGMSPCGLVDGYQHFVGLCSLHLRDECLYMTATVVCSAYSCGLDRLFPIFTLHFSSLLFSSVLQMVAIHSSEMASFYRYTRRHIQKGGNFYSQRGRELQTSRVWLYLL